MKIVKKHPRPWKAVPLLGKCTSKIHDYLILDANKKPVKFPRVYLSEGFFVWEKETAQSVVLAFNEFKDK